MTGLIGVALQAECNSIFEDMTRDKASQISFSRLYLFSLVVIQYIYTVYLSKTLHEKEDFSELFPHNFPDLQL